MCSHAHLLAEQPDQVADLHRRASAWYEQHGSAADAIRHALAAEDFERAADLVELAVPAMRRSRQEATLLGWLKALPDELLRCRPVLSVAYAWVLLASGELEGVEARLRDAERWLDTTADRRERPDAPAAEMVVVDEEAFRRLPGSIAIARAGLALALGDVPATVTYARRALDLVTGGRPSRRAERQRRSWGSPPGRAGISRQRTGRMPMAWRVCRRPGTSLTPSVAQSPWLISGLRKVVSARPCAPTSRHCSLRRSRARLSCGERQTCTWE